MGEQGHGFGCVEEGWQPFASACHGGGGVGRRGGQGGDGLCVCECVFPGGFVCGGVGKLLGETPVCVCTRVEVMCVY